MPSECFTTVGYRFCSPANAIDSFDPFNSPRLAELQIIPAFSNICVCRDIGTCLAFRGDATLRMNCEAVLWKITTRGFTLEEVLIMVAMNLFATADAAATRKDQASQK